MISRKSILAVLSCGADRRGRCSLRLERRQRRADRATSPERSRWTARAPSIPFAQAAAEQFQGDNPDVKISVGEAGTSGGFEKFCAGEIDISNASRPIEPEEVSACKKGGIKYFDFQVANDGIAIVTNPALDISCLTTDQLKQLWEKDSKVTNYSQLGKDADTGQPLPDASVSLYGPGTDSGTFDYFTEVINGEEDNSRDDYQPSEDDNVLVEGVAGDQDGLGYFGFSYYEQNTDKLNLVSVDGGKGCIAPSKETIQSGDYAPLSRPLFMYPNSDTAQQARGQGVRAVRRRQLPADR